MNNSLSPLVAISLVAFVPTISILFTLVINEDEFSSQLFFIACKIWIFAIPTIWYFKIDNNRFLWAQTEFEGLRMGTLSGILMSAVILLTWILFGSTVDVESMIMELESTGLTDLNLYLAGMIYWIFFNSLLEEYVFRWFITTKGVELFGNELSGIILSAFLFTIHHGIALYLFGFVWWQTIMACFGLLSAAAIWSWLYLRYESVWVCWVSHAICDVAVFGIGYILIFG
ncbi:MAG: hypothetical protein CMA12_03655 [Euryarchaeota archaeon]|nr:hypothetical protein [Euryarchaeota archaeon]OUW22582.1 MAG: hypothetical protein CBD33_02000 [Euryarchaeota archaeon TMED173]|tara:strand:+ start:834 stop:1520 length:687 start_codon:yes stop_codon:yes gene_type:complete